MLRPALLLVSPWRTKDPRLLFASLCSRRAKQTLVKVALPVPLHRTHRAHDEGCIQTLTPKHHHFHGRYRPSPPSRRHSPVSSCHIQASCQPNVRSGARYTSERQSGDGSGNGNVASLINYTRLHAGRRAAPLAGHIAMGAWPRERDTTSRACSAACPNCFTAAIALALRSCFGTSIGNDNCTSSGNDNSNDAEAAAMATPTTQTRALKYPCTNDAAIAVRRYHRIGNYIQWKSSVYILGSGWWLARS